MNAKILYVKQILYHITDYLENHKNMFIIRKGFIMALPFILLGSYTMLILYFPFLPYQRFITTVWNGHVYDFLYSITIVTFGFLSPILTLTISYQYSLTVSKDTTTLFAIPIITVVSYFVFSGFGNAEFDFYKTNLSDVFISILVTMLSCRLYSILIKLKFLQSSEKGIDMTLQHALQTILPGVIIVLIFAFLQQIIEISTGHSSLHEWILYLTNKLLDNYSNSFPSNIFYIFCMQTLCFFCIPYMNIFTDASHSSLTLIYTSSNFKNLAFHNIGYTYLCMVLAILLFSKHSKMRKISKLGLPLLFFNIYDVVFFGIPIAWNPVFFIPYILVPIICTLITELALHYFHMQLYNVRLMSPIFVNGYLSTHSINGILLQLVCITVGTGIFVPFVKFADKQNKLSLRKNTLLLTDTLNEYELQKKNPHFLARTDILGSTAQTLASDLKYAIVNNELFMVFQPQVNTAEKYIGAEALLRWNHPVAGYIYPPLIISLAKEADLLYSLEEFIFDKTCQTISELEQEGINPFKISVNITSSSLKNGGFLQMLESCIEKHHIKRENLSLEMTEQEAFSSSPAIIESLQYLKNKNHKLLIDDFGMGHTSLLYLETNLFDVVKLDGSLTRNVLDNPRVPDIISSIIQLSRSLNFTIVSEYIENPMQKAFLTQLGSQYFQGYLYSRPIIKDDFIKLMKQHYIN